MRPPEMAVLHMVTRDSCTSHSHHWPHCQVFIPCFCTSFSFTIYLVSACSMHGFITAYIDVDVSVLLCAVFKCIYSCSLRFTNVILEFTLLGWSWFSYVDMDNYVKHIVSSGHREVPVCCGKTFSLVCYLFFFSNLYYFHIWNFGYSDCAVFSWQTCFILFTSVVCSWICWLLLCVLGLPPKSHQLACLILSF